jgi:hypothetical protein
MKTNSSNSIAIVKTGEHSYEIQIDAKTVELRFTDIKPSKPFTFATATFRFGGKTYSFSGVLPDTDAKLEAFVRREADMVRGTILSGRSFDPSRAIARSLRF